MGKKKGFLFLEDALSHHHLFLLILPNATFEIGEESFITSIKFPQWQPKSLGNRQFPLPSGFAVVVGDVSSRRSKVKNANVLLSARRRGINVVITVKKPLKSHQVSEAIVMYSSEDDTLSSCLLAPSASFRALFSYPHSQRFALAKWRALFLWPEISAMIECKYSCVAVPLYFSDLSTPSPQFSITTSASFSLPPPLVSHKLPPSQECLRPSAVVAEGAEKEAIESLFF